MYQCSSRNQLVHSGIFAILTFLLSVFCGSESMAQSGTLEFAKKGDFVYVQGSFFYKEGNDHLQKVKCDQFMFVEQVEYNRDSSVSSVRLTDGRDRNYRIDFDSDGFNNYYEISRKASFFICDTCRFEGDYMRYICNDSTAFYSTHPAKPFKYGEAFDYKKCLPFKEQVEFYEIKPGDSVASIGAASGWCEGILSVFTDSVDYLIQDINSFFLFQEELDGVAEHYSSVRENPQTNTFRLVIGTENSACLPEGEKFDKIILNNTYHHFDKKWLMMDDLAPHLADQGKLILSGESFSNLYYTNYHGGCEIRALKAADVIRFYAQHGLYPVKFLFPPQALDNVIIFGKNREDSEKYRKSLEEADKIIFKIDRLYTSAYAGDTAYIAGLKTELMEKLPLLHAAYDSLDTYFTDIAYVWMDRGNYDFALSVSRLADELYPGQALIYFSLGEAYLWMEDDRNAGIFFDKAVARDPELETDVKNSIKERNSYYGITE